MLYWAAVFLVISIVAGVLGLGHASFVSSQIAWVLFAVFLILFVVSLLTGLFRGGSPRV